MNEQKHDHKFIEEMKNKLAVEKKRLLKTLEGMAHREHGDFRANYLDFGRHQDENASEMAEFEVRHGTTEVMEERLEAVERALARIDRREYGITGKGRFISVARLRANPAAESE